MYKDHSMFNCEDGVYCDLCGERIEDTGGMRSGSTRYLHESRYTDPSRTNVLLIKPSDDNCYTVGSIVPDVVLHSIDGEERSIDICKTCEDELLTRIRRNSPELIKAFSRRTRFDIVDSSRYKQERDVDRDRLRAELDAYKQATDRYYD